MFAPFQYLLSIVNCMLLPPDELCPVSLHATPQFMDRFTALIASFLLQ